MTRSGSLALLVVVALASTVAACGGSARRALTDRDRAAVAAGLSDIVYQCQSQGAGYTEGVDRRRLTADVDALLRVYDAVRPDATLVEGRLRTTPRRAMSLARDNLQLGDCSAAQAKRLDAALSGEH